MKSLLPLCAVMFLSLATLALAHRLDEYLQATTFAVNGDHVEVQMRLTPGVEVFDRVLAAIDANGDGIISEAEQRTYAKHVSRELLLQIDGHPLQVGLVSFKFPKLEEMKEGLGDILLNFEAALPQGGINRRLAFENHHLNAISVYLVNVLSPVIRIFMSPLNTEIMTSLFTRWTIPRLAFVCPYRRPVLGRGSSDGWIRRVADRSLRHFSITGSTTSSLAMIISCLSVRWCWQRRRFGT
jgi:hypothetical protein